MVNTITASSVTEALRKGIDLLLEEGEPETSRNGPVLVLANPVCIEYNDCANRVLTCPIRNANPFFHLMESLWMLAGGNDLAWPLVFNSRFKEYSDDGVHINGAYGYRWRQHFHVDQLDTIVDILKNNPSSRRAVLQMWCAKDLTNQDSKDLPCNTHAYFTIIDQYLNMTVCNRSNDAIWGAFGANAVHFSILLEYMAHRIGVYPGSYIHFTNNLHVYTDVYPREKLFQMRESLVFSDIYNHYENKEENIFTFEDERKWRLELATFMQNPMACAPTEPFIRNIAQPMCAAWMLRNKDIEQAILYAHQISAYDWRIACVEWLLRYQIIKAEKGAAEILKTKTFAAPDPNSHQVGGAHYRTAMQHWDYTVSVLANRYLEGQIVKYVTRYRRKNGLEDLKKALHFTEKLSAVYSENKLAAIPPPEHSAVVSSIISDYCDKNDLTEDETRIVLIASSWRTGTDLARLQSCIEVLIHDYQQELIAAEPGVNYTNQDAKGAA